MSRDARKPVFGGLQTTQAHLHSLISAFVIRLLESSISKLATGEISIFKLVSEAEQTGLGVALFETLKTGFLETRPSYHFKYA